MAVPASAATGTAITPEQALAGAVEVKGRRLFRSKWSKRYIYIKGNELHICKAGGTPELQKVLLIGAVVDEVLVTKQKDAWRNLFRLISAGRDGPDRPLVISASTSALQAQWIARIKELSVSQSEKVLAAYGKSPTREDSTQKDASKFGNASYSPLQLGASSFPNKLESSVDKGEMLCWSLAANSLPRPPGAQGTPLPGDGTDSAQQHAQDEHDANADPQLQMRELPTDDSISAPAAHGPDQEQWKEAQADMDPLQEEGSTANSAVRRLDMSKASNDSSPSSDQKSTLRIYPSVKPQSAGEQRPAHDDMETAPFNTAGSLDGTLNMEKAMKGWGADSN